MEADTATGGKRFLPPPGGARQGGVYGADKALLREVLFEGDMRRSGGGEAGLRNRRIWKRTFTYFWRVDVLFYSREQRAKRLLAAGLLASEVGR